MKQLLAQLFLCACLCLPSVGYCNDLKGTEFWLGFMENLPQTAASVTGVVITSSEPTSGVIEIPAAGWSQAFTVGESGTVQVNIPSGAVTNEGNMSTAPKGVRVTAEDPVYVSLINEAGGSGDAAAVLPTTALGYDYYASTYIDPANTNWGTPQVLVVAIEDNTQILITPSGALSDQSTAPFEVTLNQGESFQIQSYWEVNLNHQGEDLSGTHIQSICNSDGMKHRIAVFSGNKCTLVGGSNCSGCDHLVEQLFDVNSWGDTFMVLPPPNRNQYVLKVVAAYDNTTVSISPYPDQVLNAGESMELETSGNRLLTASEPVSVAQITYGQSCSNGYGDPMMTWVPSIDHFNREWSYQSFDDNSGNYLNYLTIVTADDNTGQVNLNGVSIPSGEYDNINVNPDYVWATIDIPMGENAYHLTSSEDFIALPHGYTGASSYYLNSGSNFTNFEVDFSMAYLQDTVHYQEFDTPVCACEPIDFIATYYNDDAIISWDFGDGDTAEGFEVQHEYLNGTYDVTMMLMDDEGCILDTLIKQNVEVNNCDILSSNPETICAGETITLSAYEGNTFEWSTGETTSSIEVSPEETTTYSLIVDGGDTPICNDIIVYVHPASSFELGPPMLLCETETAFVQGPEGFVEYQWSDGSSDEQLSTTDGGLHWLTVTDENNCQVSDSIEIAFAPAPIWDLGPDQSTCEGETVTLIGPAMEDIEYLWSTQETTAEITVEQQGGYLLTIDDGICETDDYVFVEFIAAPSPSLAPEVILCDNQYTIWPTPETNANYLWSTGDSSAVITVDEDGIYEVTISNECGSIDEQINVIFDCDYHLFLPNSFTPNQDGINDQFLPVGTGIATYELIIFDRWGAEIFKSTEFTIGWTGNINGAPAPIGVYPWRATVQDVQGRYHQLNGHVTLMR